MVQWFYRVMGQEFGPVSSSVLVQLRQRGEIDPFTHVRKGPSGEWVAAARVQGLFGAPGAEGDSSAETAPTGQNTASTQHKSSVIRNVTPPPVPPPPPETPPRPPDPPDKAVWPRRWRYTAWVVVGAAVIGALAPLVISLAGRDENQVTDANNAAVESTGKQRKPVESKTPMIPGNRDDLASRERPVDLPVDLTPEELFKRTSPAVVTLQIENESGDQIGRGSGFILNDSYVQDRYEDFAVYKALETKSVDKPKIVYVLTNFHVIEAAVSADVQLDENRAGFATDVLAESEPLDLAILQVWFPTNAPAESLILSSDDPQIGATVYAIGSPRGLSRSLSQGIVSGYREVLPGISWLQTTAPISPGSSGGPLLNSKGQVAGVTTASRIGGQNLNFVVPASEINRFLGEAFRPRPIWKGRSISKEENAAFLYLKARYPSDAIADEILAAQELYNQRYSKLDPDVISGVISRLEGIRQPIPAAMRHLYWLELGRAHMVLATTQVEADSIADQQRKYRLNKHFQASISALNTALECNADFAPSHEALVMCHELAFHWTETILASDSLLELAPFSEEVFRVRGHCYQSLERFQDAIDSYERAAELDPLNVWTLRQMAAPYKSIRDWDRAAKTLEQAIVINQSSSTFPPWELNWDLAWVHEFAGNYTKAITYFERAKSVGGPQPLIDEQIARCRERLR